MTRLFTSLALAAATLAATTLATTPHALAAPAPKAAVTRLAPPVIHYRTATVDGVKVFYREAGPADGPVVLLLHGFPTSSHMFRNLIPLLADKYRVIAPDYPGYGQSDAPDHTKFSYTFANQADVVDKLVTGGQALRPIRHGLRRADRLPPGAETSRTGQRPDRPERQRL